MKSNQSIHLTIKQPPNPNPIKTLGIFDDPDSPAVKKVISHFLEDTPFEPKDQQFEGNIKDEVLALLSTSKTVAVSKKSNLTIIYLHTKK